MRNFIFILLCSFVIVESVFAETIYTSRPWMKNYNYSNFRYRQNQLKTYNNQYQNYRISQEKLNNLERYALRKNYFNETDLKRVERLENLAFGTTQSGNLLTRYNNVEAAIFSRPQYSYKTSFLNNLSNFFNGQTTGYTPSIIPSYSSEYYDYSTPFNNSYKFYNNSTSGGTGINILN